MNLNELKPNELIRLAIKDMKATLAQGLTIDMTSWGRDIGKPQCTVCFAGSIMLQENLIEPDAYNGFSYSQMGENTKAFEALDSIRQGKLERFCNILQIDTPLIGINGGLFEINEFEIDYEAGQEEDFYNKIEAIAKLWD